MHQAQTIINIHHNRMASSESVLNELTSLEKETRLARERFQKTLDDIADDNNISRSPRIKKSNKQSH